MWQSFHNGKFTKIFIQCDENAVIRMRGGEDGGIAWIRRPSSCPDDIMSQFSEGSHGTAPNAGIEENRGHQDAKAVGKISILSLRANRVA